ncbi:hypothetical protein BC831DRAFT_134503 [Entophlyctis helioformis]|nr:hypothetical protein BC831DRAFT_134503 [Entophlyctis helioformis]
MCAREEGRADDSSLGGSTDLVSRVSMCAREEGRADDCKNGGNQSGQCGPTMSVRSRGSRGSRDRDRASVTPTAIKGAASTANSQAFKMRSCVAGTVIDVNATQCAARHALCSVTLRVMSCIAASPSPSVVFSVNAPLHPSIVLICVCIVTQCDAVGVA